MANTRITYNYRRPGLDQILFSTRHDTVLIGASEEQAARHNELVANGWSTVDFVDPIPAGYIISGGQMVLAPSSLSAVSSWFRLASSNTTIAGLGYNRVEDVLNPTSPAVQATDALRPPAAVSSNGLPILNSVDDVLMTPLGAWNNGTTAWGFWAWLRQPTRTTAKSIVCVTPFDSDASTHKLSLDCDNPNNAGRFAVGLRNTTTAQRGATFDGFFALNTWEFLTVEFDGLGATEADRCVVTRNGVIIPATAFSDLAGTPGTMPSVLLAPTGNLALFSNRSSVLNPWVGNVGPNWGFLGSKMSGATQGLLTPAARLSLMNFERPI